MRTKVRLWRWRHNPLRRRSDAMEAWTVLAAAALMAVGGPVVGAVTAWSVEDTLLQQRQARHTASAVLTENAPLVSYADDGRAWATVRWTAPDGSVRTGEALVKAGQKKGTSASVWLDRQGSLTTAPASAGTAAASGALAGGTAAAGTCLVLVGGVRVARWRLDRGRAREWEREWAQVGPQWGRRTA